jgi:hypothetical protein
MGLRKFCAVLVVFAALGIMGLVASRLAMAATTQTSGGGGIEVKVTPRVLSTDAAAWEFDVAFNTHTASLEGDPVKFSVLVDAQGGEHAPLVWEGDPPGGHHRNGVLRFTPLIGRAQVELRIKGIGGVPTRSFRWPLR